MKFKMTFTETVDTKRLIEDYDLNDTEENERLDFDEFYYMILDALKDCYHNIYSFMTREQKDKVVKTIMKEVNFNKKEEE